MSLSALRRLVGFRMGVIGQCFRLTVIKALIDGYNRV